jgi:hypothetical protein
VTRNHIETAIQEGIPFLIKMADGEKHEVTNGHQIALGKAHVVVMDKRDLPHVLPMLTMTGISYLKRAK